MKARVLETAATAAMLAVLAAAQLLSPAPASADDDWSVQWSNGFKVESKDKKFSLKFGGRIQADYTFVDADDALAGTTKGDGFEFRRARLFVEGTIYERVEFKAQYDFAGGETAIKDLYIGLEQDWGTLRFGHFHEQFSMEELTSSKYIAFLERSLPVEAFAPSRNSGVGVLGHKGDKLNWGVGAFYDADDFAISTDESDVDVTARVGFRPLYQDGGKRLVHIGFAATHKDRASSWRVRAHPESHFSGRFVDTGSFAADDAVIYGFELAGVFDNFWFASEIIQADVNVPVGQDPSFGGAYVQAGYYFGDNHRRFKTSDGTFDRQKPAENWGMDGGKGAWEIALRYSTIDLNDAGIHGGEQDDVTVGLNWYPNPATRLMIDVVMADVAEVGDANFILLRWQVDF